MLAHKFYPCQLVGTHRSGKFCKYLPQFGYDVTVVTVDPRKTDWPIDESLCQQIPDSTQIRQTFHPFSKTLKENLYKLLKFRFGKGGSSASGPTAADVAAVQERSSRLQEWLSVPDKMIWWSPWAILASLAPARRADVIYASCPPYSVLVSAATVKALTNKPLVLGR